MGIDKLLGEKGRWKMATIGLGKLLLVALLCQSLLVAVGLGFPNWSRLENADDPELELNRLERKFYANLWPSYLESNSDDTQSDEQSDELTENIKLSALLDQRFDPRENDLTYLMKNGTPYPGFFQRPRKASLNVPGFDGIGKRSPSSKPQPQEKVRYFRCLISPVTCYRR